MDGTTVWFNTDLYTPLQLWIFGIGCFGWVVAYFEVIRTVLKQHFIEIPAAATHFLGKNHLKRRVHRRELAEEDPSSGAADFGDVDRIPSGSRQEVQTPLGFDPGVTTIPAASKCGA